MADANADADADADALQEYSETTLLGAFIRTFQENPVDERDKLTSDEKFKIFICLIESFKATFGEEQLYYKPNPEVFFFRTARKDVDDLHDRKPLFMNLTPKGNLFVDVKVDSVKVFRVIDRITFINLTWLSLLVGFSIKSGKQEYKDVNPRGIFDIFSYDIYNRVATYYGVQGFVLFDTVDTYRFNTETSRKIIAPENIPHIDTSVKKDLFNKVAIPFIPQPKLPNGGALYPEFILSTENKEKYLTLTNIINIKDFYKDSVNVYSNGDPTFNFMPAMTGEPFILEDGSTINPKLSARQSLVDSLLLGIDYPFSFPYLYVNPEENSQKFAKFFDSLIRYVRINIPEFKLYGFAGGKNIKLKARRRTIRKRTIKKRTIKKRTIRKL